MPYLRHALRLVCRAWLSRVDGWRDSSMAELQLAIEEPECGNRAKVRRDVRATHPAGRSSTTSPCLSIHALEFNYGQECHGSGMG